MSNWANTFGTTVDESNVASGYVWNVGDEVRTGTNDSLTPSTEPPLDGLFWYGTFGGQQPALSAVESGVMVPGVGLGTALPPVVVAEPRCIRVAYEDDCGTEPIEGARVLISTDADGVDVVRSGLTNSQGLFEFTLTPGTYFATAFVNFEIFGETQSFEVT